MRVFEDGGEVRTVGDGRQAKFGNEGRGIEDVLECLQLGHVVARLSRHRQAGVIGWQASGAVFVNGPGDSPFTPVVRSQGKVPVTVHLVDGLQVVERGGGGGDDVASLVFPPVLVKLVAFSGGRDELPQAHRLGARVGHRVIGALDHRQQRQFGGHAAFFQFLDHVMQVAAAAFDHPAHVVRPVHVPLLVVEDEVG